MPTMDGGLLESLRYAGTGAVLGLAGGLTPGPLTALVMTQTLQHGTREGVKVALVPVCTDGPLVVASAFLVVSLEGADTALGILGLVGAAFLLWLAWDTSRAPAPTSSATPSEEARSVQKALMTNLLNPHPYLFWITVGGPIVAAAWTAGGTVLVGFCAGFFGCLCGSKVALATLTGRYREALLGPSYRWIMRGLAVAMVVFAVEFARGGLERLALL
jgi:threonine/homoserine/homoserine lactone efflux protein